MKITIKSNSNFSLNIPIPLGIVDNRIVLKLIKDNFLNQSDLNVDDEKLILLIKELRRLEKELPDEFCLVDIRSKDGSVVKVTLN